MTLFEITCRLLQPITALTDKTTLFLVFSCADAEYSPAIHNPMQLQYFTRTFPQSAVNFVIVLLLGTVYLRTSERISL